MHTVGKSSADSLLRTIATGKNIFENLVFYSLGSSRIEPEPLLRCVLFVVRLSVLTYECMQWVLACGQFARRLALTHAAKQFELTSQLNLAHVRMSDSVTSSAPCTGTYTRAVAQFLLC
jgi:hypothetical protein